MLHMLLDEELFTQEMNQKFSDYLHKEVVNDVHQERRSKKSPRGIHYLIIVIIFIGRYFW